jgi:hypothetical protein
LISKNAANADRAQHEIVQEAADLDQTCGLAAIQLERVRNRMGDVYRPVQAMLGQVGFYNLVREALGYIDVTRNQTDRFSKVFRYIVVRNPY